MRLLMSRDRLMAIGFLMMVMPTLWVLIVATGLVPLWTCVVPLGIQVVGYKISRMADRMPRVAPDTR